jgi:hypothetical protein
VDPGSGVLWFDCSGDAATDQFLAEVDCAFSDEPLEPHFTVRRQVNTSFDLLDQSNAQQLIQDYYNTFSQWPNDNTEAGLGPPNTYMNAYVSQLAVSSGGVITITFGGIGNAAHPVLLNKSLSWIPQDNGNSIQWRCGSVDVDLIWLPPQCRNPIPLPLTP